MSCFCNGLFYSIITQKQKKHIYADHLKRKIFLSNLILNLGQKKMTNSALTSS